MAITGDIAVGVGGNIATSMLLHQAKRLQRTKLGQALVQTGLLAPDFTDKLRSALAESIDHFFAENPHYHQPIIVEFLLEARVSQEIGDFLLNTKQIDIESIRVQLADALDVPRKSGSWDWPQGIDASAMLQALVQHMAKALYAQSDPALALVATRISGIESTISGVEIQINELKRDFPRIFQQAAAHSKSEEVQKFESSYLDHMAGRFGRLTTPGARDLHGVKQALSVAYISLNVRAHGNADPVRAEQFLRENPNIVVRGPAGSGKTTLLSFVVWCCTREGAESSGWTGGIPIFIPLRTVARTEQGPPQVERFVGYSVDQDNWALETPKNWTVDILREKRGLIMLDGVDELPASRRSGFWEWLAHFVEEYPGNRIIVTSRALPGTTGENETIKTDQWNVPDDFVEAQLEEMSDADVARFIEHWHDAVDTTKLELADKAELTRARDRLPSRLADPSNKRIRELCSTPLLCAMVCVLHWREEGYLPRQRVELYDRCCEMLIEARDLKRLITAPPGPLSKMTKNDKERVLQRLAFEMMDNQPELGDDADKVAYRIEISRAKAMKWIEPWIDGFQIPEARAASSDEVLNFLIERTGLLREPAGGLIDFPHRTFQEYLAACAAGAGGKEGLLANKADDDQWHETIMLAAGTTTGGVRFGHELIEALLRRAERQKSLKLRSQRIRKTCFALALGALENLRQPDPILRDRVLARVDELVPPNDESGAKVLAVAGDAAVPHLQYSRWKDERTVTVAACAQALRLIGTSQARRAIEEGYIADRREPVIAQVCRSDEVPFASIPLIVEYVSKRSELPAYATVRDCSLLAGLEKLQILSLDGASVRNISDIKYLPDLKKLYAGEVPTSELMQVDWPKSVEEIHLDECPGDDFDWLLSMPNLKSLTLVSSGGDNCISVLGKLKGLASLSLLDVAITDPSEIGKLAQLKSLVVVDCGGAPRDWPFSELRNLERLVIDRVAITNLADLKFNGLLKQLEIRELDLSSVDFLSNHSALQTLRLHGLKSLTSIDGIDRSSLESLSLVNLPNLRSLSEIRLFPKLRTISICNCSLSALPAEMPPLLEYVLLQGLSVRNVEGLRHSPQLKYVEIDDCGRVSDLTALGSLAMLKDLQIEDMPRLDNVNFLKNLAALQNLRIVNCAGLETLEGAEALAELDEVVLVNCPELETIAALVSLPNLKTVSLVGVPKVLDLAKFVESPSLENLKIRQHDPLDHNLPEALLSKVQRDLHIYPHRRFPHALSGPAVSYRMRYQRRSRRFRLHPFMVRDDGTSVDSW